MRATRPATARAPRLTKPFEGNPLTGCAPRYQIYVDQLRAQPEVGLGAVNMLQGRGHTVTIANNGQEAVDAYEKTDFDAILMDVQMPEMNGYEATGAIRELEAEAGHDEHIPIIAMTANAMKGDRDKCLESGMDDYVAKPVRSEELFKVLRRYALERKLPLKDKSVDVVPAAPDESESTTESEENSVFDEQKFRSAINDDALMIELISIYEEDTPEILRKIAVSLDQGDTQALHRASHSFKGQIGNYEARAAFEIVEQFDFASRTDNLEEARRLHPEMVSKVTNLTKKLQALKEELSK